MSRIGVAAVLKAIEGKEAEVEAALSWMVGQVESEAGTLVYALSKLQGETGKFHFYELYEDQASFQAHGASATMKELGAKLGGLLAGRPELVMLEPVVAKGL